MAVAAPAGEESNVGKPTTQGGRPDAHCRSGRNPPAPFRRLHLYEKERIAQEEYRLQQDIIRCHGDAAGLQAQIEVLDFELSLL